MNFGFKYGYSGIGLSANNTICVTTIGNSGTTYGYRKNSFGEASPGAAVDGSELYEFTWDTATGIFTISFGPAGTTVIENLNYMIIRHNSIPDANIANLDISDYKYTDSELATALALLTSTCFDVVFVPIVIAKYTFTVSRGTK